MKIYEEGIVKILHLLTSGEAGGIESLCRDIGRYGKMEHTFCFVTKGGAVCQQMKQEGMDVYDLGNLGRKLSIKKFLFLKKLSKNHEAIIVHHDDPFLKLYFILLYVVSKKYAVTMVHSCYGDESQNDYRGFKRWAAFWIFQKCFDISDKIWFVSEAGKTSCLTKYSVEKQKCRIIYNGISPQFIEIGAKNKVDKRDNYNIVYIGRLSKEKGVHLLIEAFSKIADEYDVALSIIGGGKERDKLEKLVSELKIEDKVKFWGQQLDVGRFLAEASIFVYPSTCQEVFGISIVEAMAYGIPCIANRVGGIPEIIEDGKNGFLTDMPSAEEIAVLMKKVISMYETGEIEKILEEAKVTAKKFSICATCEKIESELLENMGD